jgi:DNA polymerase-3 subunit delta
MIVKSQDADRFVERPPKHIVAALIYGPDQGLVRERAESLVKSVVPDLSDAFRIAELDESGLASDGARLSDEAAAIAMFGGRRVVRVRNATNGLANLLESFLDNPKGDALVVVEGGDLAKSAALRKVFDQADNAAGIACYTDSPRDLSEVVRSSLKTEGLAISPDALEDAVTRLGADRGVTRRELEKLALYMHGQKRVELEDVRAIMGDEAEARTEEACDAAGDGDMKRLDLALERLWADDVSPAQLIRTALSHFQRVLQVKLAHNNGESVDTAMKRGWPTIHFSRTASFKAQVSRWNEERLLDVCDLLLETEAQTRTTAVPAQVVTARAFFSIAAMARTR